MPGKSWKDLKRETTPQTAGSMSSPEAYSADTNKAAQHAVNREDALERAKQVSPRLARLLEERKALENRLRQLTSGSAGIGMQEDLRQTARFQVLSFAERQAQQREWETQREKNRQRALMIRKQMRQSRPFSTDSRPATTRSANDSLSQWLSRRDAQRENVRNSARDRLSPLNDVAGVGRQLTGSLSNASRQLRDLDRQLAEQDMDQERDEIRRRGGSQLAKAQSALGKYTKMAEAPMRAINKVDHFWKKRQEKISGAMDKSGSYVNRSRRKLSTEQGGSGDLFERMERNRQQALKRRQEKRDEEARDEARRQRAKRNKRKREKENKHYE